MRMPEGSGAVRPSGRSRCAGQPGHRRPPHRRDRPGSRHVRADHPVTGEFERAASALENPPDRRHLRAFSPTSFITQRDGSCRRNSAHGWLTHLGGRLRMPVHSWEPVESHRRPTSGHIEPIGAFDSSVLPGIQTQPDTSTDIRNLVRIGWSSLSNLEPMDHKSGYGFPCVSMAAYLDRSGARLIEGDRHDQIAQPMRRHHHRGQRRPPDRASAG
jgi:hypothetical protein